jgi:hypothetical protein
MRRRYRMGRRCQDCGRDWKPTTRIVFLSGFRYWVCGDCVRAYQGMLMKPCRPDCAYCAKIERGA